MKISSFHKLHSYFLKKKIDRRYYHIVHEAADVADTGVGLFDFTTKVVKNIIATVAVISHIPTDDISSRPSPITGVQSAIVSHW